LRYGVFMTFVINKMIGSRIVCLLDNRCPSNIPGFIVAIVVSSVNAVLGGWSFTNIIKKVFKRIEPSIANPNTTTAVVIVIFNIFIIASTFNMSPYPVFWSFFVISSMSVFSKYFLCVFSCALNCKTTTGFCTARPKIGTSHNNLISTFTLAKPHRRAKRIVLFSFYDGKATKLFISNIFNHNFPPIKNADKLIAQVKRLQLTDINNFCASCDEREINLLKISI